MGAGGAGYPCAMHTFEARSLFRAYAAVVTGATAVALLGAVFVLLLASGTIA